MKADKPPTPEKKVETFASGFAAWQLKSSKFRPPPPKPNHRLYREDVEYDTWEEHYDDEGARFFYNPSTNKSQWDIPEVIAKAMAKEEAMRRRKEQDEIDSYYASHGVSSEGSGYYGADGSWVEGGYDENGNWLEYGGGEYDEYGNYYEGGDGAVAGDEEYYDDDYYPVEDPPGSPGMRQLTDGNEGALMDKLGQLQALEGRDDDEEDWDDYDDDDDDPDSRPLSTADSKTNNEGGGTIEDEIERTRRRVANMNFVPKKGAQKKWGLLRGVKNVLNEVNEGEVEKSKCHSRVYRKILS